MDKEFNEKVFCCIFKEKEINAKPINEEKTFEYTNDILMHRSLIGLTQY